MDSAIVTTYSAGETMSKHLKTSGNSVEEKKDGCRPTHRQDVKREDVQKLSIMQTGHLMKW